MSANVKRETMAATPDNNQMIARLTSLAEVLAALDAVEPVGGREMEPVASRVLATDVLASTRPAVATALIDGWAINAEATRDAGSYAPAILPKVPPRIDAGEAMPKGANSVVPFDSISVKGAVAEALVAVTPGDGVLPAGSGCDDKTPLRRAGDILRASDVAVFAAAGVTRVRLREPRIRIMPVREDAIIAAAAKLVASDIERQGGLPSIAKAGEADALVVIGGTGSGRNDRAVTEFARTGRLAFHGIGLRPGETAALGFLGSKPVLLMPGRIDAALAVWLTVGRRMLAKLSGMVESERTIPVALTRKVTSTVGLAEFVPVHVQGDSAEPLASNYLPLSVLARANGWILVPAESEGYQAGTTVAVRAWL
jgi:molybdopterin molybdotransferase